MKKIFLYIACLLTLQLFIIANPADEEKPIVDDSAYIHIDLIDSLTNQWYFKHPYLSVQSDIEATDSNNIDYPDSVYIERISHIPSILPLSYNKIHRIQEFLP